ncbi:LETM1 domain-containing protein 1 [Cephus cinctus]|uniref:LETM1 domain-containing protein 1 n=1 Tax=Cephus cinctus TaxID=211228 RepID=A0AAJ7BPS2_CEPCN|nr:LETM1 domain-containing protein 1 [Cephus cinctus]
MHKFVTRIITHNTIKKFPSSPGITLCQIRHADNDSVKEKYTKVAVFRKYWFSRYLDYIKNYEKTLEKNFPKTMHVYRVFSVGTKDFYVELKKFLLIKKKLNIDGEHSLSRQELEINQTMPRDLLKISPVLLISAIPFTNYIIFPLAYFFPRHLLTYHYWSLQQRLDFLLIEHKKRLKHNKPLFRCMQAQVHQIKNRELKRKWRDIIACLGSGTHPTTSNIIACIELFTAPPYSLSSLKRKHIKELLAIHGMNKWCFNRKSRLLDRGLLIKEMDDAIRKEGGVTKMHNDALKWALSFRGVNPVNMSVEGMQDWLEKWLEVSCMIDENSISLLLHCPILLAYNHETNWILLYH